MPLPGDFNSWEHLQSLLISLVNRMVREEFSDLKDDEIDNILISRSSLRTACWLNDQDSAVTTLIKLFLFFIVIKQCNFDEIVGIFSELPTVKRIGPKRKEKPKVSLLFSSDARTNPSNQIWRLVSFRVMDETSETLNLTKARTLAQKIKSDFKNFSWDTGRTMYSYADWERGYQFQILGSQETDAKNLIKKVMGLQNHSPNWTYFSTETNDSPTETYPSNPPRETIMGEIVSEPARRPIGKVYFRYANLSLYPKKPICLYDTTGRRFNPLID